MKKGKALFFIDGGNPPCCGSKSGPRRWNAEGRRIEPGGPVYQRKTRPPKPDREPTVAEQIELAYRRGFHQGAAAAVEAVDEGFSLVQLQAWVMRLYRWRRKAQPRRVLDLRDCATWPPGGKPKKCPYPEWLARD